MDSIGESKVLRVSLKTCTQDEENEDDEPPSHSRKQPTEARFDGDKRWFLSFLRPREAWEARPYSSQSTASTFASTGFWDCKTSAFALPMFNLWTCKACTIHAWLSMFFCSSSCGMHRDLMNTHTDTHIFWYAFIVYTGRVMWGSSMLQESTRMRPQGTPSGLRVLPHR